MKAFGILWQALKHYYEELLYLLVMGFITVVACVLILPGPLAIAGLWYVGHRVIRGYGIKFRTYWEGIKEYGLKTYLVILIVVVVYIMLYLNIWFYGTPEISPVSENIAVWITIFWVLATLFWTGAIFYFEAFLIEQVEPKVLMALRNSAAMMVLYPLSTLIWLLFIGVTVAISVVVPVLLGLVPSMLAILSLTATRTLVKQLVKAQEERESKEDASSAEITDAPPSESAAADANDNSSSHNGFNG